MATPFNSRVDRRQRDWHRLAALLDIVDQGGLKALSGAELAELSRLHRRVSSHLAQAQGGASDPDIVAYLNGLVVRSHNAVYRVPTGVQWRRVGAFLTDTYPRTVRKLWPYVLVASLVFFGSGLFAFILSYSDPTLARLFVPAQFAAPSRAVCPTIRTTNCRRGSWLRYRPSSYRTTSKVGFTAFAGAPGGGLYPLRPAPERPDGGRTERRMHHYGNVPMHSLIVLTASWAVGDRSRRSLRPAAGLGDHRPWAVHALQKLSSGRRRATTVMLVRLLFVVAALMRAS